MIRVHITYNEQKDQLIYYSASKRFSDDQVWNYTEEHLSENEYNDLFNLLCRHRHMRVFGKFCPMPCGERIETRFYVERVTSEWPQIHWWNNETLQKVFAEEYPHYILHRF